MAKAEQIGKWTGKQARSWIKRRLHRLRRLAERAWLRGFGNEPDRKQTRGWFD